MPKKTNDATRDNRLREHGLKPATPCLLVLQTLTRTAVRHLDTEAAYLRLVERATPVGLVERRVDFQTRDAWFLPGDWFWQMTSPKIATFQPTRRQP